MGREKYFKAQHPAGWNIQRNSFVIFFIYKLCFNLFFIENTQAKPPVFAMNTGTAISQEERSIL